MYNRFHLSKTLKEEKKKRNEMCQKIKGTEYEYDPSIDVYGKYRNVRDMLTRKPFTSLDCTKIPEAKKDTDKMKRYYSGIKNKRQCDEVKGHWSARSLNRDNYIDEGVCWVRPEDAHCSTLDTAEVLKARSKGQRTIFSSTEMVAARKCLKDSACEWAPKTGECVSKSAMDFISDTTVPEVPKTWPADMTAEGFQSYLVKYYAKGLDQMPQRYMPVIGKGNRCVSADGAAPALMISQPQTVVNMFFKALAASTAPSNRGMLVWHSAGSGKTCTAAGVMESFWDREDKNIVFVSSVEALASNPPEAFMKCAINYLPRFKNMVQGLPEDQKLATVRTEFERRNVRFMSFAQLAHYLLIANPLKVPKQQEEQYRSLLKNAILIIDEVHNIFRPLPHQRHEHTAIKRFLADYNNSYTKDLQIAILTATPGETIDEVIELLNMIRDRKAAPIKAPDFKSPTSVHAFSKSIRGLISYFDIASDMSKYPRIVRNNPYVLPMSMMQYSRYAEAFNSLSAVEKDYDALQKADKADKYYKPARRYANMLFNLDRGMSLYDFSSKLPALIENIKKYPNEKHYIYSTFFENRGFGGHGVLAIAKILEKELGYTKIDFRDARRHNAEGTLPAPPKRRYMLAITNELDSKGHTIGENLQEMVKLFSHPENKHGDYVHIFLASQKFNEGVDFKGLRHIHMFEPLLSYNKEIQTVGRGARYCSHKDLDIAKGEWTVTVHKYIADFPVDSKSMDTSRLRGQIDSLKREIHELQQKQDELKGKKSKDVVGERARLKQEMDSRKKSLLNIAKDVKRMGALDTSNYVMVDKLIETEVQEKLKDMTILLQVMKQSSVDCKLFKDFHAQSGNVYKCLE